MDTTTSAPDLLAIKGRQQQTWSSGDYARIGNTLVLIGEQLCEAVDLRAGQRVLDVATGSGNTALAAARRFCEVTGTDYVPALLEASRQRAAADALPVTFVDGDAEHLPFPDGAFDVVLSSIGAMFAPDQPQVARELLRVCRSGGKIGMANWTPEGFIGTFFRTMGKHVPPPKGLDSPMLWGTEARLRELLGDGVRELHTNRRMFVMRYPSPRFYVDYFRSFYGPTLKAFATLSEDAQQHLADDLEAILQQSNVSGDETLVLPCEYLEVVALRK